MSLTRSTPAQPGIRERRSWSISTFVILLVISVLMMVPLVWLLSIALKANSELTTFPVTWWPKHAQWHNFVAAQADSLPFPFWRYAWNSLAIAMISATLSTLSSALVGFGFARLEGVGKRVLFAVLIMLMMTPPIITLIPTYLMFAKLNLVGTFWPWVLWGLSGSSFAIFLMRQFFTSLPKELDEAAIVDGCSRWGIFWRIALPLSKPALITVFLGGFVWAWGDWITPTLLLDSDTYTLAVGVATGYVSEKGYPINNVMAAGALLYIVPMIILFAIMQRGYVQGMASTGLKG